MRPLCKTYYVDPLTGRDENDGLHEDRAFATLFAVNRLALAPGDTVLLRRGCRFEKQFLRLRCGGTEGNPSPSALMVKAAPPASPPMDRASGIRTMGGHWAPMFLRRAAV